MAKKKAFYQNPMWIIAIVAMIGGGIFIAKEMGWQVPFAVADFAQPEPTIAAVSERFQLAEAGTASTITFAGYDNMADSRTAISEFPLWVSICDRSQADVLSNCQQPTAMNTSATYTQASIGDGVRVWGGSASYHMGDAPLDVMVNSAAFPQELEGFTRQSTQSYIAITCRDSDEQPMGTYVNSSRGDYNITLGANGDDTLDCKIKNNAANAGIILGAICVGYDNDLTTFNLVSEVDVNVPDEYDVGGTWSPLTVPKHVASVKTTEGSHSYKACYQRDTPLIIPEWGYVRLQFEIGCTADCTANLTSAADMDLAFFVIKDVAWALGDDGYPHLGIADMTSTEADVGVDETEVSPEGRETGVVIVAI